MIAAIAILLPAILHAQQGTPEAIARLPGMSWEGPPGEVEWEPVDQVGSTDGGITIYYARQIASGVKLSGQALADHHTGRQPSSIESQPAPRAHINQHGNIKS